MEDIESMEYQRFVEKCRQEKTEKVAKLTRDQLLEKLKMENNLAAEYAKKKNMKVDRG